MNVKYIRRYLMEKKGYPIVVIYYGSRKRKEKYKGVLYALYANLFIIKLPQGDIKCFTYADILTKTIQIYL